MAIRFKKRGITAVAAVGLMLAGCGSALDDAQDSDVINIGAPVPLSGPTAETGQAYYNGVQLAVEHAREAAGGDDFEINLTSCDTEGTPTGATTCARRLQSQDRVIAQLATFSSEAFPLMGFNEEGETPFILTATSSADAFTRSGNGLTVRYWPDPQTYMPGFIEGLIEAGAEDHLRDVAIMATADEFGESYTEAFRSNWEGQDRQVVATATFTNDATDFYAQLNAIMRPSPDAIAIPTVCSAAAPIIRQARELGFDGDFIMITPCQPEALAEVMDSSAIVGSYFEGTPMSLDSEGIADFRSAYQAEFGEEPDAVSASGYIAARTVIVAAQVAGDAADAYAIREAMPEALARADDEGWNLLGFSDMTDDGNTTSAVHVRRLVAPDDVEEIM